MCGLIGALAIGESDVDVELVTPVRELAQLAARRGPDDAGVWTDGASCALGFRRLAILDLSPAGHQPMIGADGRYALVFNGEIYNYRELRAELATLGRHPRSSGDAEVLLLALAEWGTEALRRLNGMFALAFYDIAARKLLLARDHVGIKPLHYARTPRGIVFASQHDQIRRHPWVARAAFDPATLALYLRFGFVPAPHGMHTSTAQLEAGTWLELDATGRERIGRYFELPKLAVPSLRGDDAVDACEAAIEAAVRRQLVSDVPLGVFLSGGIDSPLVAAIAARAHGAGLEAFTIAVEDRALDESSDAARYATELGLVHHVQRATAADALALLDDVIGAATEPTADYSMFPTLMVSRLARARVTVALSGDGGDELFWGYPSRFASAIEQAPYFAHGRAVRAAAVGVRKLLGRGRATREVVQFDSIGALYRKKHSFLSEPQLAGIFPTLPAVPADFDTFTCDETDPYRVAQWVRWNELRFHLARVLHKVDRASMHESLEVRVPLLDREVVELAWRVDWRTCLDLRARVGKQPLRRALARRTSAQAVRKRGFEVPMAAWLATSLAPLVQELLLDRRELAGLPVRPSAIAELYARLRAGDRTPTMGLWLLLSLALWQRAHEVRA